MSADQVAPRAASEDAGQALALLTLYGELHRQSRSAAAIDVTSCCAGPDFYERYYFRNRPVLIKGAMRASPALQKWSPAFFGERYGSVPVEVTSDRNRDAEYELHFRDTRRTITLADFVKRLMAEGETNDVYLVARNYFFENPALRPLRNDLAPPAGIIDVSDWSPGTAKLWFGPKGTVTPLHYDEHSIFFTQIYGRKTFKLVPSFEYPYMYVRNKYYSAVDAERVDATRFPLFPSASVVDVVVEPGDALFLPVGWWHWARSLDISISATFCSFHVKDRNTALPKTDRTV